MSTLLVIYQLLVLSVLLALLGIVITNLLVLPRLVDFSPGGAKGREGMPLDGAQNVASARASTPLVAVLVPARNEEVNIEP
ncbi:MAG TPA: hypothetical protein VEW94_00215, partial [Chloroflexia bacterium]|nr:hypothetical protein [Chloroflexia bacterium]